MYDASWVNRRCNFAQLTTNFINKMGFRPSYAIMTLVTLDTKSYHLLWHKRLSRKYIKADGLGPKESWIIDEKKEHEIGRKNHFTADSCDVPKKWRVARLGNGWGEENWRKKPRVWLLQRKTSLCGRMWWRQGLRNQMSLIILCAECAMLRRRLYLTLSANAECMHSRSTRQVSQDAIEVVRPCAGKSRRNRPCQDSLGLHHPDISWYRTQTAGCFCLG